MRAYTLVLRASAQALALAVTGLACGGDDPSPARRQPTGAMCTASSTTTYASFAQAFFAAYCTSCHARAVVGPARAGAPAGLDFDTVEGIRAAADRIDRVAASGPDATNPDMPPGNPRPSAAERARLGEWLACGAP